jgi:hypothetical protein
LWAILAILLLLHGITGALVVSRFERIPLIWYLPADAAEIALFIKLIVWAFAKDEAHRAQHSG